MTSWIGLLKSNGHRATLMHVAHDWPKSPSSAFAQAFPQINFALMWDSQLINARVRRLEEQCDVGMKQSAICIAEAVQIHHVCRWSCSPR
jgi:hypothetical protein